MHVQTILQAHVTRVTLGPVGGNPVLEPRCIAMLIHVQHQIGTHAVKQLFAIVQTAANLSFQQGRNPRQQQCCQLPLIGLVNHRIYARTLIQPDTFM
ncbi:hypothetical protein D3C80_1729540 [compost metagenome]